MEEQPTDLEVTVKTLDSQSRTYTVRAQLTVKDFKEHIAPSVGIPIDKQRLIYQGRVLQDDRTLHDYNVGGKVIHLVERAPPPPSQPGSGSGASPVDGAGSSPSSQQGAPPGPPHDRNANSYVMLGTFNLPVNIMDPQQIQMSVQQMVSGMGESARNARVTTSTGSNGSVNVHIDMEQPVQSEPRLRLVLAENLLRDVNEMISRMESRSSDASSQTDTAAAAPSSGSSPSAQPMDTSPPPSTPPPPPSSSAPSEGPTPQPGPHHPSPAELAEMLTELRRVEERLQPFIQRAHTILETATSAEYGSNAEREEDQRALTLTWECLRLLGNALVALSDLRLNLMSPVPRHLHVVRPFSHYSAPFSGPLPGAMHPSIPLQMNLGATVTVAGNSTDGQAPPPPAAGQSEQAGQGQAPPSQTSPTNQQAGQGQAGGPRVIRISHQAVPLVLMQMNADAPGGNAAGPGPVPGPQMPGQPGPLPQDFMRNLMQQISQYAAAVATSAATASATGQTAPPGAAPGHGTPPTGFPAPPPPSAQGTPPQPRVVFGRPPFPPNMPPPAFGTRGTTINVRAAMPGQQPGQAFNPAALNQMISGLMGQLLLPGQMAGPTVTTSSSTSTSSSFSSTTSFSGSTASSGSAAPPQNQADPASAPSAPSAPPPQPQPQDLPPDLGQLLGSLLGMAGGAVGPMGPMGAPSITVTTSGMPAFIQGVSDFMQQASQPVFPPPPSAAPGPAPAAAPPGGAPGQNPGANPGANPGPSPGAEGLNPELFTGILGGVLRTMMGSLGQNQNDTESIAQFMQRLSQATNIFISPEDPTGFFGELLMLVCQTFTMSDLVLLLHGQHQPLGRIQPQLAHFFRQNYLSGREPTEQNIADSAESLINELEEYISESFRESSVSVLDGVDATQTNMSFFRQQLTQIATHILHCTDESFGPRLLQMCNAALFQCLALNLFCLRGDQRALTAVINHRIRRMSSDISPSLVNWMTSMMSMRLQVILENIPVPSEQIQQYVVYTQRDQPSASEPPEQGQSATAGDSLSPAAAATTAEEFMSVVEEAAPVVREAAPSSREHRPLPSELGASGVAGPLGGAVPLGAEGGREESEAWAAAVPPEWVPIIRCDMMTQRKIKSQPPLSDAYLQGMPAKRRKTGQGSGSLLSLSDAVSQAARTAGVRPITTNERLQHELETDDLREAYSEQVKSDLKKRLREDPDFTSQQFPNSHRAFSPDS